jgi:hypothetical protein
MAQQTGWVFREWLSKNGWKMQSIFVNGLRAPDVKTSAVKKCVRWMRTVSCHNADPSKADCYMSAPPLTDELVEQCVDELEYLTCHYVHHFADSMRIVALFHPDMHVRSWALKLHNLIAEEIFHFVPETDVVFVERHKDKA